MNPIQVKMFIEQILGMPPHIAAQQLQANVQHLDNTFFQILQLMIQNERKNNQY